MKNAEQNAADAKQLIDYLSPYIMEGHAAGVPLEDLIPYAWERVQNVTNEFAAQQTDRSKTALRAISADVYYGVRTDLVRPA